METISPDLVRAQVRAFWESFCGKDKAAFAEMYSPMATVFSADARRCEPARLMLVRRERELFGPKSLVKANLGAITVQMLAPDLAAASYSLHFSVTRTRASGDRVQVDVPFGRATQVFHRNEQDKLIIIHEHMSSAEPTKPITLGPG